MNKNEPVMQFQNQKRCEAKFSQRTNINNPRPNQIGYRIGSSQLFKMKND